MISDNRMPDLPKGVKPSDPLRVRVRENNSYGTAQAGEELTVPASEWRIAHRALELAPEDPTPQTPTSLLRPIPAALAKSLGLPTGQEPIATYEVTLWPQDAEQRGMLRREELERQVQAPLSWSLELAHPAIAATAEAMGYDPDSDGEMADYVERNIARCIGTYRENFDVAKDRAQALDGENADWRRANERLRLERDDMQDKVASLQQSLRVSHEETAAARDEATRLTQELAQLKAETAKLPGKDAEAAPEQVQVKGRSK